MASKIPLFRDLQRCRSVDHVEAFKEVIVTVILAILPIWLGAGLLMLVPRASVAAYVGDFLASGEALLVSAALIGPSIYVITKKYGDLPKSLTMHFPQGWFLVVLWFVICMFITAIFGSQRIYSQIQADPQTPLFDVTSMQRVSAFILIITIGALYIVTVFKNFVEDGAAAEMRSGEAEFLADWKRDGT